MAAQSVTVILTMKTIFKNINGAASRGWKQSECLSWLSPGLYDTMSASWNNLLAYSGALQEYSWSSGTWSLSFSSYRSLTSVAKWSWMMDSSD